MGQGLCSGTCGHERIETHGGPSPEGPADTDRQRVLNFLADVKLFKRLPPESISLLASACTDVEFRPGQVIIQQGDEGHEFFVIKQGEALVNVSGKDVATLKAGDYFGEHSLLRDEPRAATVQAKGDIEALKLSRDKFLELGLREKLDFPQRKAVAGGGGGPGAVTKPPSNKTTEDVALMTKALKANENLATVMLLDDDRIRQMINVAWEEEVAAGKELIKEGDLSADYFYIVKRGTFNVLLSGSAATSKVAMTISRGGSFGELALLYFAPRAATVKATEKSTVWVIDRGNFKKILAKSSEELVKEYLVHLNKVSILAPLKKDEKEELAKCLTEMTFKHDETIFTQGEKGEVFCILVNGEVSIIKDNQPTATLTATPKEIAFFGEKALLNNEPRAATVKVTSKTATALMLDRQSFDMLLGPLAELKKRPKDAVSKLLQQQKPADKTKKDDSRFGKIKYKDLKVIGLLGCGGFGTVELVEQMGTSDTFALKGLSKGYVVKSGMQKSVMSEKEVQLLCDSPFIVKLFETFSSPQQLYFLLELALGGELYATYNKKGFFGKEQHAKFYVAGVVNAFIHMHGKKIVFRDLKPENILLNEHGHVKVTDMGLAKVVLGKTFTTCGTPDYFAPELIASSGHSHAVDWWTLGVLTFELMVGKPPFESAQPMQIYQKVNKGINKVNFPSKCKGPLEDFVKKLCQKNPSDRLPMTKGGADNIKKHAWYKGFDWNRFSDLTMDPPYKPSVKSKKDIQNFSAHEDEMPPKVQYKDDGSGWDKGFATSD
eukprot:TRINITY_DN3525_c0_g1_i1.p1 TRINITY_DN3525_c0_g1~~TRINITY_DN3525_c0_g1_i1.p1  ORF type:complete len:776 (+),score=198.61 TRINITY_DN3525_c0_g1_i1:118-2445(+)